MTAALDKSVAEQPKPAARDDASGTDLRVPGRAGRLRRYEPALIGMGSVLLFLISWQAVASARLVPPLFLPGPLDIVDAFLNAQFEGGRHATRVDMITAIEA